MPNLLTTKKKIAVIDLQTPFGHLNLINFYIKNLTNIACLFFLNKKIKSFVNYKKLKCFFYNQGFFKNYFDIYKNLILNKIDKVFFLSYSPVVLFFFSFFLLRKKIDIFLIEHDTLNKKKKVNFFFNKILSKKIIRLVYNTKKKIFILRNFSNQAIVIDHPILKDNNKSSKLYQRENIIKIKKNIFFQNKNKKKIKIFVPSRFYLDKKKFFNFYEKNKSCFFLVLSKNLTTCKNILKIQNIKDNILKEMDYIYIANRNDLYENRISSWVYTSVAHNKKIVLDYGDTYKYEKQRFQKFIFLSGKLKKNTSKNVLKFNKHKQFVNFYNKNCIKNLILILIGEM
jgi:hypothetical protein